MKCDNLQRYSVDIDYVPNDDGAYMDADEVNEAIAELKQKLAEKDKEIALLKERICNGDVSRSTWIDDCIAKDKEIEELKAENERLKFEPCNDGEKCGAYWKLYAENEKLKATPEQIMKEVFDKVLIYPKEMVRLDDVYKLAVALRATRRALWIARAELCRRLDVDRYLRNHRNSWYNENCLTWADACVAMEVKMCKAERKCRAKAEEYK